jgi:hypothetical protein
MTDRSYETRVGVAPTTHAVAVRTGTHRRISWGAVLAGVVLTLAIQLLLSMLGVGVGLSTVDPSQTGGTPGISSLGIGAGVWWTVSYVIALAVGGYVAARLAGVVLRGDGMIHGLLTWALALLVSAYLVSSAVGTALNKTFDVLGTAASSATQALQQAAPEATQALPTPERLQSLAGDLLRPGDQPQGGDPSSRLVDALGRMASGQGGGDQAREEAITIISEQAQVSRDVAAQRVQQVQDQLGQAAQTATQAAETTTDTLSSAGIGGFVVLLLGAIAGMLGGRSGTRDPDDVVVAP